MKNNLLLLVLVSVALLFIRCTGKSETSEIDYIKVIAFGDSDSVTAYNKGIGIHTFAYYEPKSDSFFYISKIRSDSNRYKSFTCSFKETIFRDSFLNVLKALQKYGQGNMLDTTFNYCVNPIYLEYKMNDRINYQYFIEGDDTINIFTELFFSLSSRPITKQVVEIDVVNIESEAVNAMKRLGKYVKMEEPYLPVSCVDGIDKSKIYGSWRYVHEGFNSKNSFNKVTFEKNGTYFFENVDKGIVNKRKSILEFGISGKFVCC